MAEENTNSSDIKQLQKAISSCCTLEQHALRSKLRELQSEKDLNKQTQVTQKLVEQIQASAVKVEQRKKSLPTISFDDKLPINQRREEISKLIDENQVVVVAGETGSGKTTQIPKICLSLGLGNKGLIGHTQPRRIAARTVGKRIADELNTPFGDVIGYQVRFADQLSDNTRVKLMTDGVLLSEFQQDKFLNKYEVIIIDEAHERSLNIDFLLGLLKELLKKRKDLKLIITSATIDLEKFSNHFDNAPVIEVSGRTFPVDVLYHPPEEQDERDLSEVIASSVSHIIEGEAEGEFIAQGDILIFCAGEREIRDTAKALTDRRLPVDVLPLYSRLGIAEQNKVFQPSQRRKVVLATNVAETSITVPGIAYVIDPGVARISRYSFKSKVQRLQIEPISQASANQRKGRCGRVANGVCVRLYAEEDFNARPEFTDAELLRSNLAAVILQLLQLQVRDIGEFPFIDKPDNRLLNDGFKLLEELQAIDSNKHKQKRLTGLGRKLSRLPLDPKYGRMLLEANTLGCLPEMIIIVAALSIQDPREFPADKKQAAREKHRLMQHKTSDFYGYLILWFTIEKQRKDLTNKQFKEYCKKNFLSVMRIFEWRDMVRQLKQNANRINWQTPDFTDAQKQQFLPKELSQKGKKVKQVGLKGDLKGALKDLKNTNKKTGHEAAESKAYTQVHRALLSGLLGNIAIHEEDNTYLASRGRKLAVFPSSVLSKNVNRKKTAQQKTTKTQKKPTNAKWIMANDLIETSRLFAHTVAEIEPAWIQKSGEHLLRFSYSSPNYHERAGAVKALQKATLYGLTLRDKTSVIYSDIDPTECRKLFIQQALVEGAYARHPQFKKVGKGAAEFYLFNQSLINDIEQEEAKARKRNLLISDSQLYDLYDALIPEDVVNYVLFEQWRKQAERKQPDLLKFSYEQLTLSHVGLERNASQALGGQLAKVTIGDAIKGAGGLAGGSLNHIQDKQAFPNSIHVNGKELALSYHFNPGDANDGVTLSLPVSLLTPFPDYIGDWLVPGLLHDKCVALIKSLPKAIRKRYAPAMNAVNKVLPHMLAENRALHIVLGEHLKRAFGFEIPEDAWGLSSLEEHFFMNYKLIDKSLSNTNSARKSSSKNNVRQSRDLNELKQAYGERVSASLRVENSPQRKQYEQDNLNEWSFGKLAEQVEYEHQGMAIRAYSMLQCDLSSKEQQAQKTSQSSSNNKAQFEKVRIDLRLHESKTFADFSTRKALIEFARTPLKQGLAYLKKEIFKDNALSLHLLSIAPSKQAQQELAKSLIDAAILQCCFADKDLPRTKEEYEQQVKNGSKEWIKYAIDMEASLLNSAKLVGAIKRLIADLVSLKPEAKNVVQEVEGQIQNFFAEGFLSHTTLRELKQLPRYLECMKRRIENAASPSMHIPAFFSSHHKDVMAHFNAQLELASKIDSSLQDVPKARQYLSASQPKLKAHLIMLEEWRVSIYAQQLKTQYSVSEKRVLKHWAEVQAAK